MGYDRKVWTDLPDRLFVWRGTRYFLEACSIPPKTRKCREYVAVDSMRLPAYYVVIPKAKPGMALPKGSMRMDPHEGTGWERYDGQTEERYIYAVPRALVQEVSA